MSTEVFLRRIKRRPAPIFISLLVFIILLYWMPWHNMKNQDEIFGEIGDFFVAGPQLNPGNVKWKTILKSRQTSNTEPILDPETIFRDGPILKLAQNDSQLLEFIREHHLFEPSDKPYNLTSFPTGDPTEHDGKSWEIVYKLLKNKIYGYVTRMLEVFKNLHSWTTIEPIIVQTNGFFIEVGVNKGEFLSNTLVLERDFGWTGLLIEGDPSMVNKLLAKNRKAWVVDLCLSKEPYPQELQMQRDLNPRGITLVSKRNMGGYKPFTAKSVPIFSILSALDVMFEVDLFSVDIDTFELPVLKTIPFDSVFIKIFVIESLPWNARKVVPFLETKGYVCLQYIRVGHTSDFVFIHESLYEEEMSTTISVKGCYRDNDKIFTRHPIPSRNPVRNQSIRNVEYDILRD